MRRTRREPAVGRAPGFCTCPESPTGTRPGSLPQALWSHLAGIASWVPLFLQVRVYPAQAPFPKSTLEFLPVFC